MDIIPVITIDGPSSSGKSTICKEMASQLHWNLLNSGAIYRSLALSALYHYKINITSEKNIIEIAKNLDLYFILNNQNKDIRVILDGKDVTLKIRTQKISNLTSHLASIPKIREALLNNQRSFRKYPGLIADGRDMGTVIFPDAPIKIFLDACLEQRVERRMIQLRKQGFDVNFKSLLNEIKKRDDQDIQRIISPLLPAKDAFILNTTNMSIKQVISKIMKYVKKFLKI